MELILPRQSVVTKCILGQSVLLGNYELYYAGGLLCRLAGQIPDLAIKPDAFYQFLTPIIESYVPQNDRERYLIRLLKYYKAGQDYDDQMPELLQMGLKEKHMWIIK